MKLVCSQAELSSSLQLVSRAVAGRPTHPVLANVLLTADAATGRLSLTGYDLNLGIQTSLPAAVETSGAITLPARLFADIVSRLSADSPLTLSCGDGEEQVELTSLSGSYRMRGMPAEDFPDLPLLTRFPQALRRLFCFFLLNFKNQIVAGPWRWRVGFGLALSSAVALCPAV